MSKKIITISREFGSGGRFIGSELAKRLGIPFYDKELIGKVAEKSGFAKEFVEKIGEYSSSKSIFSYAFVSRTANGVSTDDLVFQAQREVILDIAQKESCVIVGRCADYILEGREDVLNVFVYGNMPEKTDRIKRMYDKTEREAIELIKSTDKKRAVNYQYCTDRKWGSRHNYDICLNSSTIGYDRCIDIIEELFRS